MNDLQTTEIDRNSIIESDLPEITPKMHEFVHLLMQNKMTIKDCYLTAYDANPNNSGIASTNASTLKRNPKIIAWINYYKANAVPMKQYTVDEHFHELEEARQLGIKLGNVSGMVGATRAKGEIAGHYAKSDRDKAGGVSQTIVQVANILGDDIAERLISHAMADGNVTLLGNND